MVDEALKGDLAEVDGERYGLVLDIGGYYENIIDMTGACTCASARCGCGVEAGSR